MSVNPADWPAWISQAVDLLGERGRLLWTRLVKDEHYVQTYNELVVAALLQEAGMQVRYEVEWGGLTPDFTVLDAAGQPAAIVEVFTRRPSTERQRSDGAWRRLQQRIRQIPVPVMLRLVDFAADIPAPDDRGAKAIAAGLAQHLQAGPVTADQVITVDGYHFLVGPDSLRKGAELVLPGGSAWVNSDDIIAAIKEKATKYAQLADTLDVPLIVALGAEPGIPVDLDMLRTAMGGQLRTSVSVDSMSTQSVRSKPISLHATDAPPRFPRALSAVAWIDAEMAAPGRLTVLPWPDTHRPHGLPTTPNLRPG